MSKNGLTIAHWVANLAYPVNSLEDWAELVRAQSVQAADAGADILLIPEHISENWAPFMPAGLAIPQQPDWVAGQGMLAVPMLETIARETGIALAAGSFSYKHETTGRNRNRAWIFFPDRAPVFHDKLVMTPSEKDPNIWLFETGDTVRVFEWRGWRIALIICLDVEMPHLAHRMSAMDIDLLLVPSMTTKLAGFHRVFSCARARAVELMTAVSVVGCVGGHGSEQYHSAAAVYVPSEEQFGHTGIFAEIPMRNKDSGPGEVMIARDIPLAAIRDLRRGKQNPEAWPGPWPADHVQLIDETRKKAA